MRRWLTPTERFTPTAKTAICTPLGREARVRPASSSSWRSGPRTRRFPSGRMAGFIRRTMDTCLSWDNSKERKSAKNHGPERKLRVFFFKSLTQRDEAATKTPHRRDRRGRRDTQGKTKAGDGFSERCNGGSDSDGGRRQLEQSVVKASMRNRA